MPKTSILSLPPAQPLPPNPTKRVYDGLTHAYDYFNRRLFKTELPRCLITMQRKSKAYGYFAGDRFGEIAGTGRADEIALNPQHFAERSTRETLATLVHEMAHLWQHHWGKTGCRGYHNKQWATRMKILGLYPSSTSQPGGKELGHKVSHYIVLGGSFDRACDEFLKTGFAIPYGDLWAADEEKTKEKARKRASKTKFVCVNCEDTNAWGKPGLHLVCGECNSRMIPQDEEGGDENLAAAGEDNAAQNISPEEADA